MEARNEVVRRRKLGVYALLLAIPIIYGGLAEFYEERAAALRQQHTNQPSQLENTARDADVSPTPTPQFYAPPSSEDYQPR